MKTDLEISLFIPGNCECLGAKSLGVDFPSLNTDSLHTDACSKASVLSPVLSSSSCQKQTWKHTACPTSGHKGPLEAHREGEGSGVKSKPCSGHICQIPSDLNCWKGHKPGFTFLTFTIHPTATGPFLHLYKVLINVLLTYP